MKVALDISPLSTGHKFRGIGQYTQSLVEALGNLDKKDLEVVLVKNSRKRPKDCDLIHYPYFDFFFNTLPLFKKTKTIVTVHDTIPLIFPHVYPPGIKGSLRFMLQKFSLSAAAAIITDSNSSKEDIKNYLGIEEDKIHVVYLSQKKIFRKLKDKSSLSKIKKKYSLAERFVLYVGDIGYNKNVLSLVKACKLNKIALVIVGKQAAEKNFDRDNIENKPLLKLIERYGRDRDVRRLGFVDDGDLVGLYNLAEVYCQPSYYEGFGLPVLEAMACGCPVVASNRGSLPEVCAGAGLMVDPESIEDIARGIRLIIEDGDLRKKLIEKGLKRAACFSWQKTALNTYEVYKKVVEG